MPERRRADCPSWCTETDCRGEHGQKPDYIPASGGLPHLQADVGAVYPAVAAIPVWDEVDSLQPCVSLVVATQAGSVDADLLPAQAWALVGQLKDALEALQRD